MKQYSLILGILLIATISAQLTINPLPLDATTKINTEVQYQITLTNNHTFDILDFEFKNLEDKGFTFPIITIPKETTQTITISYLPTQSIKENVQVPVSFKYFVELSNEPQVFEVNITDPLGFAPDYLPIHEGDSIIFTNNHEVSIDLVLESNTFILPVNATKQYTFNNLGIVNYYDIFIGYSGVVEVLNKTSQEKAHNPNYDINWVVNLEAISNPTTLSVDNSKSIYEIESGTFKKGLITIKNNGTERAEIIHISSDSDWISFNKNDLNIEVGEEDWIEYTITPILFDTNSTDKNHELNIKVKASNSEEYIQILDVFVPFKEITNELGGSDVDTLNWLKNVFCPDFPSSFLCNQTIGSGGNGTTQFIERQIGINVTEEVIYDLRKQIIGLRDSDTRTSNELKILTDNLGLTLPELKKFINESLNLQLANEKKVRNSQNTIWILGFFIVLFIMIAGIIRTINKRSYKASVVEWQYKYKI